MSPRFGIAAVAVLALLSGPGAVAAQQGDTPAPRKNDNPWVDSYFPYISSAPYDFPMVYAHFSYFKKADYYDRSIFVGNFSADAGISFRGSRALILTFDAPLLWPHWRLAARVGTYRQALLGYHGLGNNTTVDKALQDSVSDFYRVSRTRYWVQAEASRELVRRVFVAVGGTYLPSHFSAVSGLSQFRNDYGDDLKDTDVRGSLRLVYDGRNNEYNPKKGLYAEVSGMVGSGGDGYQRYGAVVAGWLPVPITEGTNLAAWIGGSNLTGTPPLNARFEVPVWEQEVPVLGGAQSNRGIPSQRFVGTGVLDARLEARQDIIDAGDFGAVIVFVFTDAGRVFENEPYRITTDGLKVGYGGGLAIRILRSTVITFNFAGGPEGFQFSTGARWPF